MTTTASAPAARTPRKARQASKDRGGWRATVRAFLVEVEPVVLEMFVDRLGARAAEGKLWSDVHRAVVFRAVCTDAAFGIFAELAEARGLPVPPAWVAGLKPRQLARLGAAARGREVALVGVAYENLLGRAPRFASGEWRFALGNERREGGVFFTPPELAGFLVESALGPRLASARSLDELSRLRVIDPAMGAGAFLTPALRLLSKRMEALGADRGAATRAALTCLHGVDRDPMAVGIARASLWLEASDTETDLESLSARLRVGDALLGPGVGLTKGSVSSGGLQLSRLPSPGARTKEDEFASWVLQSGAGAEAFDWERSFPGVFLDRARQPGFDVVLGNPPWGKIKAEIKEFFSYFDSRVRDLQGAALRLHAAADVGADAAWRTFRTERSQYAKTLRAGGAFSAQRVRAAGVSRTGDDDLYKYFLERAHQILAPDGRLGFVVPAGFYQSEGATGVRGLLLRSGEIEELLCFENRDRAFPIHGMFKYVLLVWQAGATPGIRHARFNLPRTSAIAGLSSRRPDEPTMTTEWVARTGGERLIVPEVRDIHEQHLYGRLHALHPVLGAQDVSWNVEFVRELDMTKDRDLFHDASLLREVAVQSEDGVEWADPSGSKFLPLYEGRLVHQFDHAAKAYSGGAGRRARWEPAPLHRKSIRPHYWVRQDDLVELAPHVDRARAGFCDITGHANERTVLAALIPAGFPCGNKVPTIRFDRDDARLPFLWLAVANSFVVDWMLRRRVSTTINFFHWKMTPFPRLNPESPAGRALWVPAARLSVLDAASADWASTVLAAHGEGAAVPLSADQRALLRASLDTTVADIFGLDFDEVELLLKDFPLIDRRQPALSGERRSTITHDLLCGTWLREHDRVSEAEVLLGRVQRAQMAGASAYVPSEHAR